MDLITPAATVLAMLAIVNRMKNRMSTDLALVIACVLGVVLNVVDVLLADVLIYQAAVNGLLFVVAASGVHDITDPKSSKLTAATQVLGHPDAKQLASEVASAVAKEARDARIQ